MSKLYEHEPHVHTPHNVNAVHQQEHAQGGVNVRIAVFITKIVSRMETAYVFTVLAFVGLLGLLGWLNPFTFLLATWISQQFLQLVFLPILSVGQAVLGRKQELLAEEQYQTTMKTYHDTEQLIRHLEAQDEELLKQTALLVKLAEGHADADTLVEMHTKLDALHERMRNHRIVKKASTVNAPAA